MRVTKTSKLKQNKGGRVERKGSDIRKPFVCFFYICSANHFYSNICSIIFINTSVFGSFKAHVIWFHVSVPIYPSHGKCQNSYNIRLGLNSNLEMYFMRCDHF